MAQALYRKWRPQTFEDVVGQEHVVQTIRNAIVSGRVAHAYLFSGPRGTGKTTLARLLAKAVNCLNPDLAQRPDDTCAICTAITEGRLLDLIELDAASNRGIDEIRDLRDKINFSPGEARYKVYIIDEVHMLTEPAFNALLKTLEEPPPHAIFILATTDPQKVPVTIVSRCQPFAFRRFTLDELVSRLQRLVEAEGLQADPAALALVARQATGSMRDAISLLDQLAAGGAIITIERAQEVLGAGALERVSALADALAAGDAAQGLEAINAAVDAGADARQLARQIVEYLRGLLLIKLGEGSQLGASSEQRARMEEQAGRLDLDRLVRATKLFNQAASELKTGWQPQLPLELAYIDALNQLAPVAPRSQAAASSGAQSPASSRSADPPAAQAAPSKRSANVQPGAPKKPPASTPTPANGPVANLTLDEVSAKWPAVLASLRTRSVQTWGLMNSCQLVTVEGNALVLQWPSQMLCDKFEKGKDKSLVEDVISEIVGKPVRTRCVVDNDPVVQEAKRLGAQVRPVTDA
ncbi:MAG TPA: DNA polymerase III subunit gamma/tau [Anaerolineae bacterium]|nr:DNA polymerase III subunit gamma/tau [Anaerolineae bacterium]